MNNLDLQYQSLLNDIKLNGIKKSDRTGTGIISIFGRQIRHNMGEGFPLLTTKKMYWKGIVAELLWFLKGQTNIKYLLENDCHIWDGDAYKRYYNAHPNAEKSFQYEGSTIETRRMTKEEFIEMIKTDSEFAAQWGNLGPIYGKQWRRWGDGIVTDEKGIFHFKYIDQIANLINDLKTNPDSRRLMVSAWNVNELDQMVLPPCHYGFQVYTRELSYDERIKIHLKKHEMPSDYRPDWNDLDVPTRAISLMWNQRSVDVPLGLPFNIGSYGLLLHILAEITNMVPDELIGNLGDCHIYLNQIDGVNEQLTRKPYELPKLRVNTEFWLTETGESGVGNLLSNVDWLIRGIEIDDFQIENYQKHPPIKIPLSN